MSEYRFAVSIDEYTTIFVRGKILRPHLGLGLENYEAQTGTCGLPIEIPGFKATVYLQEKPGCIGVVFMDRDVLSVASSQAYNPDQTDRMMSEFIQLTGSEETECTGFLLQRIKNNEEAELRRKLGVTVA